MVEKLHMYKIILEQLDVTATDVSQIDKHRLHLLSSQHARHLHRLVEHLEAASQW